MEARGRQRKGSWKKTRLGIRERRCLIQMAVSLLLFLLVFVGQEAFPARAEAWREELTVVLRENTDFEQVFHVLGKAVAEETPPEELVETVWSELFQEESSFSAVEPSRSGAAVLRAQPPRMKPELKQAPEITDPVQLAVKKQLGLTESVTPVMGTVSSAYGMREHPIDGEIKMHEGIDLAADQGEDILAFADGKVDYIGESPAYGMYLQIRHDEGVTTFYAHCSELLVRKGMEVKKGDVIAKVGDTGNTTGPHLHFELKQNGEFLDPFPYIHCLTS